MKVLGVAASPRRNGNSETLLDKALEGAASKGADVEKVALSMLKIAPCQGDNHCYRNGRCHIKDDMQPCYKKFMSADAIIVASPVYFGSITAQLKILIDRCQAIWAQNYILKRKIKKGRKGLFISISSFNRKSFFKNSTEIIKIFFLILGIRSTTMLYGASLENPKDALKNKALLKKAFNAGAKLASPS